jgi:hypothetical protein
MYWDFGYDIPTALQTTDRHYPGKHHSGIHAASYPDSGNSMPDSARLADLLYLAQVRRARSYDTNI